jgi:hypothetical protein
VSVISLLQLAARAGIPRQREIRSNSPVVSSFLHSLLSPVLPLLKTNRYFHSQILRPGEPSMLAHSEAMASRRWKLSSIYCDVKRRGALIEECDLCFASSHHVSRVEAGVERVSK